MLNTKTQKLLENFQSEPKFKKPLLEQGVTVSRTVSAAAVLYEAARNAVEFRAEHLIRRAAIERILKRRLLTKSSGLGIAESLVRELLWARYLENGVLPHSKVIEIQETINKYVEFRNEVLSTCSPNTKNKYSDWIIGIASCEIEKKLAPAPNREALTNFVYQTLKNRVTLEGENDQKINNIQAYIAVHRSYALSDEPIIRFHLFLSYFPNWIENETGEIKKISLEFSKVYQEIETLLAHPAKDKLKQFIKKEAAPFFVIRDLAETNPQEFPGIVSHPAILTEKAKDLLNNRYLETRSRLRRAATRSIIYIFLTKMVFALLIELPFDLLLKKTNYLAITINTLFPPFLMFLVTASASLPDNQNTERVIEKIKEYLYEENEKTDKINITLKKPSPKAFSVIYFLTFIIIFGLIIGLLDKLGFSIVSKIVFLFFLTLVSFFGYRVRLDTKDYVIREKESVFTPITDFVFLPILRVGQWLSGELAQINFLIFFLDFIIEAPFKAFFRVIEEWIHFIRIKKEEIIT